MGSKPGGLFFLSQSTHSPSASNSLVTPSDSAISKACSRFSRLLCCDTTSMSIRSGLKIVRKKVTCFCSSVSSASHPGYLFRSLINSSNSSFDVQKASQGHPVSATNRYNCISALPLTCICAAERWTCVHLSRMRWSWRNGGRGSLLSPAGSILTASLWQWGRQTRRSHRSLKSREKTER